MADQRTRSRRSRREGRRSLIVRMASPNISTFKPHEERKLERPRWSGETPLSRLVGALIFFRSLYSVMKFGARQPLIREKYLQLYGQIDDEKLESSQILVDDEGSVEDDTV